MRNLNIIPITTDEITIVSGPRGNDVNAGFITANPIVLAGEAKATIAEGISVAVAGGTVLIWPDTYTVAVFGGKTITLVGTNRAACIIESAAAGSFAFTPLIAGIEVENLTFTSSAASTSGALGGVDGLLANHINLNLTAGSAAAFAFNCGAATEGINLTDVFVISDWNGLFIDGEDHTVTNLRCKCKANESGTVIGLQNRSLRFKLLNSSLYVENDNAGSTDVIGIENDTTGDAGLMFVKDTFIHVVDNDAGSSADGIAILAEEPMMLESCDIKIHVKGDGDSIGVDVYEDTTLTNCTINSLSDDGGSYSIRVAAGKIVRCIGCHYDRTAITGDGSVVDIIDNDGRVDVVLVGGAVPMTDADVNASCDTAITDNLNIASGIIEANVKVWRNTAVAINPVPGVPVIDLKYMEGITTHVANLVSLVTYLLATNLADLTTEIADGSIIAQMLAVGGDISNYDSSTDSQEAIANASVALQTVVDAVQIQTDKLDSMIDEQSGANQFTTEALTNAPTAEMDADELADAMKAITGLTVGGTWTWEKTEKIRNAWMAGNWRVKETDPDVQELLDAEDGTTVILEQDLTRSPTPGNKYRDITVKI